MAIYTMRFFDGRTDEKKKKERKNSRRMAIYTMQFFSPPQRLSPREVKYTRRELDLLTRNAVSQRMRPRREKGENGENYDIWQRRREREYTPSGWRMYDGCDEKSCE